ncbi:PepSY-like domain-containing protein, partial [Christiangramia aquimixticola]|uniref:PepSY-like domain-containing protein n=1 Tax=Christiangramia aquimixticola TaxID=1697558 RepID=UPI003AA87025
MKNLKIYGLLLSSLMLLASCNDDEGVTQLEMDLNSKFVKADVQVSTSSLPQRILNYISLNYPNVTIHKAEIEDNNNYEVYLSNGLELIFDSEGNFLGI